MLHVYVTSIDSDIYANDNQLEIFLQLAARDGWIAGSFFFRPNDPTKMVVTFYKEAFGEPLKDRRNIPLKVATPDNC